MLTLHAKPPIIISNDEIRLYYYIEFNQDKTKNSGVIVDDSCYELMFVKESNVTLIDGNGNTHLLPHFYTLNNLKGPFRFDFPETFSSFCVKLQPWMNASYVPTTSAQVLNLNELYNKNSSDLHQTIFNQHSMDERVDVVEITGVAIMKAMEMGHFELDDPINEYLPFKIVNPKFLDVDITIRHLLTHTSSLNDNDSYNSAYVFKERLQKEEWPKIYHETLHEYDNNTKLPLSNFLNEVFSPNGKLYKESEMFTKEKPGTNYEYSNLGFALLGYIIELTTKEDFRDFTKKHILDPLGMNNSTWNLEDIDPINHATYYLGSEDQCPTYTCNSIPDGGLYTNVIDLTKFLQEAMHGYLGKGKILSQSSYREMFKSQSELFEIEGGLGWDLGISCCIGHSGNDFGVSTVMYFQPSTGIGRIVFSNTSIETDETESAFYGIMNLLFLEDISN